MATNLAIDDSLLINALRLGGFKTKKDTVNQALKEFIQKRKAQSLINMFGKVKYYEDYEYKKLRKH